MLLLVVHEIIANVVVLPLVSGFVFASAELQAPDLQQISLVVNATLRLREQKVVIESHLLVFAGIFHLQHVFCSLPQQYEVCFLIQPRVHEGTYSSHPR